ncbi:hypothetical protein YUYDRAFT_03456 [Streptomyces sp. ScaeMP-e48]|uniref:hypothetical protein n=1 Tax=Streptomyces sp. ScaeMP-e48 TaxID=1100823 RepID=UPI000823B5AF|nr:hypothetical protein [Streptomyces sp. ScaeMP-e48]SCK30560.1 hypothetical protein YUYDRAFT_03456 [Streptomyces sp. ScaeMP-e48]
MNTHTTFAPAHRTPAVTERAPIDPAEARELLSDELYMARVWSLIRREEETHTGQTPPAHDQVTPSVPAALTRPGRQQDPVATGVPGWVWQYSALALSTGGFVALAGYGIGAAAPGLAHIDDILAALGQAVMSIAVLAVLAALFLTSRRTRSTGRIGTTVNIRKAVIKRSHFHG